MNDEELRSWFDELRQSDRRHAPPFDGMARKRAPVRFRLATAFLVLMIAVGVGHHSSRPRPLPIEALSEWRSPTSSLLDVPESPLLTTTPAVR